MAPSIFSSSLRLTRLISYISTFKSPISCGRMMSTTTTTVSGGLYNPSPCLMLPPTLESGGGAMIYNFYDLVQNKVISFNNNKILEKDTTIVGSSHGWLALFTWLDRDLILTNPVTRRNVKLPPIDSDDYVPRVIISCDAEQDECQAMMIDNSCGLAFCRPGRSPTEWTPIATQGRCYEDVVYSNRHKLFFCVTDIGFGDSLDSLEGWDVASDPPRLRWENRDDLVRHVHYETCLDRAKGLWCDTFMYLVFAEQADQLFLVTRHFLREKALDGPAVVDVDNDNYPYQTVAFDVYKIDRDSEGGGGMSRVDGGSLGGLAMFVGVNHSFAVSATEANGLKPNSIYFTDEEELTPYCEDDDSKYGGRHDIGIFDYENKTISPCYYPCDLESFKKIMPVPIWFTPTHN